VRFLCCNRPTVLLDERLSVLFAAELGLLPNQAFSRQAGFKSSTVLFFILFYKTVFLADLGSVPVSNTAATAADLQRKGARSEIWLFQMNDE